MLHAIADILTAFIFCVNRVWTIHQYRDNLPTHLAWYLGDFMSSHPPPPGQAFTFRYTLQRMMDAGFHCRP
ncbi:hypothetical protein B0T09DRAFT_336528 [Sordaria sp. MPI-SDFR-AT-0083]|nr:hypothetical protein B0T09DRAFT_336528 [Sordaria sp. MPI-SDFR-AT-0083]